MRKKTAPANARKPEHPDIVRARQGVTNAAIEFQSAIVSMEKANIKVQAAEPSGLMAALDEFARAIQVKVAAQNTLWAAQKILAAELAKVRRE